MLNTLTINPAKMYPCGMVARSVPVVTESARAGDWFSGVSAGVHSRTNVYIDPSNND